MMMQGRDTHLRHGCEFVHTQRLSVIGSEPGDDLGGPMTLLTERRDGAQMFSLRASKQAIDDLPLYQIAEEGDVVWGVEQIQQPGTGVQKLTGCGANGHAVCV